jgi:O-antigen ligase/Flp pilus assembly protein TadD
VRVGGKGLSLLASSTLVAALGFTPCVIGAETPWPLLLFRALGLAALASVSFGALRGMLTRSPWAARAAMGMVLLVAVSLLSAAASVHRGKSLEAMLNLLAIAGLFLGAALLLRGHRALRLVALLEVLAAVPVAAIGIAQHMRPDLLIPSVSPYSGRALGPFLQPNRLGGYLIGILPVALALSFSAQDRILRGALLITVFLVTLALVATYSRGAWFGCVLGLLALAIMVARWPDLTPRPGLIAAGLAAIALPIFFDWSSIFSRLHPGPATKQAWNLPIDPEREGSGALRRAIWSGAFRAGMERPILGWGTGAFLEGYDRSKGDNLKRLEAEGSRTADQAHSIYLQTLAERGALGLAALVVFVSLCAGAGLVTLSSSGSPQLRLLAAGLLASVAALLAHGALEDNLSFVPHGVLFSANLGMLAAMAPSRAGEPARKRLGFAGVAALTVALFAACLSVGSAAAAANAGAGFAAARTGQIERARERYAAAERLAPWNDRYAVAHGVAAEATARGGRGIDAWSEAEASYRHALALNGSDPVTRHYLARLYLAHRDLFGPRGVEAARRELTAALSQNPYYAEIRNDLGVALLASGDRGGAVEAFRRASEGRRDFVDPLLNLASLALEQGKVGEAKRMVAMALERNPGSARAAAMRARISGLSQGS